jgi:flagellar motor protein MotB
MDQGLRFSAFQIFLGLESSGRPDGSDDAAGRQKNRRVEITIKTK